MKALYLECNAGISGDMLVGALLDLGADRSALDEALSSIPAKGFMYNISRVKKAGVDCCDFDVLLDEEHENHDHDMAYLHGISDHAQIHHHPNEHCHEQQQEHFDETIHSHDYEHRHDQYCKEHRHEYRDETVHSHNNEHCHEYNHFPHEHHHQHAHRGLQEVMEIIAQTSMTEAARALAIKIFDIIAEAEAKAHAVPKNEVHFHEVGAIDSIVDIIAIAVCMDSLHITEVIVPELCEGRGTVRCQHGVLPVPVPAVANILQKYQITMKLLPVEGEFVTPTGAAAVAALRSCAELPQSFTIASIGLGAGKRNYGRPSILRAMIIDDENKKEFSGLHVDTVCKLETNIDDCTGELLGYTMEHLLTAGALDVSYVPIFMKKQRPAYELQVLCEPQTKETMEKIIFAETSTIGIRHTLMERSILPRYEEVVQTMYGAVKVKVCCQGHDSRYYIEYNSAVEAAEKNNVPLIDVYREVHACFA